MKVHAWFRPIFFGLVLATAFAVTARDVGAKDGQNIDRSAVLAGRSSFATYCKVCHGPRAEGDGPLAEVLKTKPADLTQFLVRHEGEYPFEEIVATIDGRKGGPVRKSSPCPVWGNDFKVTDDEDRAQKRIYEITNYLWTLQKLSRE